MVRLVLGTNFNTFPLCYLSLVFIQKWFSILHNACQPPVFRGEGAESRTAAGAAIRRTRNIEAGQSELLVKGRHDDGETGLGIYMRPI